MFYLLKNDINSIANFLWKFRIPVYMYGGICGIIMIGSFIGFETGYLGPFLDEHKETIIKIVPLDDEEIDALEWGYWGWYGFPVLMSGLCIVSFWLLSFSVLTIIYSIKNKGSLNIE